MSAPITPASQAAPKRRAAAVTPSDASEFAQDSVIFVGAAGTVSVETAGGDVVTIASAAGQYHPVLVRKVRETGTTATGIVRFW